MPSGRVASTDYIGYHDLTPTNYGGGCQLDDLDKETTTDAGGGCNLAYTEATEWVEYPIEVDQTGWF